MKLFFFLIFTFLLTHPLFAQDDLKRVALVIGNNSYKSYQSLNNPVNDAGLINRALKKAHFETIYLENATNQALHSALKRFKKQLNSQSVGLFYFAGHGIEVHGENYLVGIDSNIPSFDHDNNQINYAETKYHTLSLQEITKSMKQNGSPLSIIILDACRNNPVKLNRGGLAPFIQKENLFVAYSTQANNVALDGKKGTNSPFSTALGKYIDEPGLTLEEVFKRTRESVYKMTDAHQLPTTYNSALGAFYFIPGNKTRALKRTKSALNTPTLIHHQRYIEPDVIFISANSYLKGNSDDIEASPEHNMYITKSFFISTHEITFDEYDLFVKDRGWTRPKDNGWGRGMQPVINISWNDAVAYCRWLSEKSHKTYRLPSESEWEYVAHDQTNYPYGIAKNDTTLSRYAWFSDNANKHPHPIATKSANNFGLFDILGNVQEWVEDDYTDYQSSAYRVTLETAKAVKIKDSDEKVIRGGAYFSEYHELVVTLRAQEDKTTRNSYTGFRVVLEKKR